MRKDENPCYSKDLRVCLYRCVDVNKTTIMWVRNEIQSGDPDVQSGALWNFVDIAVNFGFNAFLDAYGSCVKNWVFLFL